jgi:hypothetical protein
MLYDTTVVLERKSAASLDPLIHNDYNMRTCDKIQYDAV